MIGATSIAAEIFDLPESESPSTHGNVIGYREVPPISLSRYLKRPSGKGTYGLDHSCLSRRTSTLPRLKNAVAVGH
ncbi:hypothetical protein Trydic_g22621 [Trypoxylus dichotomus]